MAEKDLSNEKPARRTQASTIFDTMVGGEGDLMGDEDRDPLARIKPGERPKLKESELYKIYTGDIFAGNWTDKLTKDLTREWISLEIEGNEKAAKAVLNDLDDLDARQNIRDMCKWDHVFGDGYVTIGIAGNADPTEPLDQDNLVEQINEVVYLSSFSKKKVISQDKEEDPMNKDYGEYKEFKIRRGSQIGNGKVHRDRILHLQTIENLDDDFGLSSYIRPFNFFTYFNSAVWSLAQAMYELTFKVYKTDLDEFKQGEGKASDIYRKKRKAMEKDWTNHRLAVVDKGKGEENSEEIEIKAPSGQIGNIGDILDLYYKLAEMITSMPRSRLFGTQAGELSASQTDLKNYHSSIASVQEVELRDKVEKIVSYVMAANGIDPNEVNWEVKFNPLGSMDQKERSEIESNLSQAAKNLVGSGVMNAEAALWHLYDYKREELPDSSVSKPPE